MDVGMNLPVMVPGLDRTRLAAWCRAIDEGPFSSLAIGERITFPNPEMMVTAGLAAAWTERVRLVLNVVVLPMHAELLVAKQAATLDVASGGRLVVGVGVGGREEDYRAVGAPWTPAPLGRLEAQVARMRAAWAGEPVLDGALGSIEPRPLRPGGPEVLAGSIFPRSIRRAARWADGIAGFAFTMSSEEIGRSFEIARAAWAAAARPAPRLVTGGWFALGPGAERQMDRYLRRYLDFMGPAADGVVAAVRTTSPAALRDALARAEGAGADEVLLVPTTLDVDEVARVADLLG